MALKLYTAPAIEPVSLAEAKLHLRVDSGSFADNLTSVQSIAPGSHGVAAAYSLVGTAVDILGYSVVVELESGTNGTGGTVDVKLQDSDDNATWADVASGGFTQVTEATDNATYEKAYTGTKHYLRVVSTVAVAACEFGVSIIKNAPTSAEDTLISGLIQAAREYCESFQNRTYINTVYELWLDKFPCGDEIDLPLPPLQEPVVNAGAFVTGVTYRILTVGTTNFMAIGAAANIVGTVFTATGAGSGTGTATASVIIKYYDTDNTEYFLDGSNYFVDVKNEPGRVVLAYGKTWPSTTLRPANAVCVTFVAGYGATAASVPQDFRNAILLLIGHLYEHREAVSDKPMTELSMGVESLLWPERIVPV